MKNKHRNHCRGNTVLYCVLVIAPLTFLVMLCAMILIPDNKKEVKVVATQKYDAKYKIVKSSVPNARECHYDTTYYCEKYEFVGIFVVFEDVYGNKISICGDITITENKD